MASIETRTNSDGTTSHRVRFRHAGKNEAKTFATPQDAQEFKSAVELLGADRALSLLPAAAAASVTREQVRTLAQQVAHHIDHLTGVEDGTRRKYRKIAAGRIDPTPLGRMLIGDITRDDVSRWVNSQDGAPKTIKNAAHGVLSPALDSAVRDGLIAANPAKGVALPKRDQDAGEHVYLEPDELATLLHLMKPHWRPFTLFLVGTGVRFSEAAALTVGDLNLRGREARIRQAWKDTSGGPAVLGPPKTRMSRRTVAIPAELVPGLLEHVDELPRTCWVFANTRGNPIRNGVFHESAWQPIMDDFEQATGKRPRVHDLRHTYASWAIRSGTALPVIQRQMGHESISVTVDTYGHLVRSDLDALAANIGASLPQIAD